MPTLADFQMREEVPVQNKCVGRLPIGGWLRMWAGWERARRALGSIEVVRTAVIATRRSRPRNLCSSAAAVWLAVAAVASGPVAAQQTGTIAGVVRSEAGGPLSGASVAVADGLRVMTRQDGRYQIVGVAAGTHTIEVTLLGYAQVERSVTVPAGGVATVDFDLATDALALDELVVVGYATQSRRSVTGAISVVTAADLQPVAATSINQMLAGKAPGLNLTTRTAQPGGGVGVNIRGAISPRGNNQPLYVVDGVPLTEFRSSMPGLEDGDLGFYGGIDRDPLAYLNPTDIESVTVLKDASAAAIYGSAAANGVVLITTKSGQEGSVRWRYGINYSMRNAHDYVPLMNARQFMTQQRRLSYDQYLYDNNLPPYGTNDPASAPGYIPLFTESDIQSAGTGTDWVDLVTRNGRIMEHNVSASGGSSNTTAYASFNYRTEDGMLETSTFDKYSGRINLDQRLGDASRLSMRVTATRMDGNNASTGSNAGGGEKFNMLQSAYAYAPTVPVYDDDGEYAYSYYRVIMNPAAFLSITDESKTTTLFAATDLERDLTSSLTATVSGEFSQESTDRGFYLPRTTNNTNLPDGAAQKASSEVINYGAETYMTYRGNVGAGDLLVVGGAGIYKAGTEGSSLQGVGFFTDAFTYNNIGVASDQLRNTISSYKTGRTKLSQFARASYTLRDRYIFSVLARRDGSSIFAENHKWGIFPGASAAWILSAEDFFASAAPVVSFLKLRFGYGEAGNESILSGNSLQLYNPGYPFLIGNTVYSGVALSQVANPDLTWETVRTANLGIDFGLFQDRLSGTFDVFSKTAVDLLDFNPLPSNNAVGQVADNVGSTRSTGFELTLDGRPIQRDRLRLTASFNVSHTVGRWIERNPLVNLAPWVDERAPLDAIYGWRTDGIIQKESDRPAHMPEARLGNIIYRDQNGDGELNEDDVVIIGNSVPRWRFGVGSTLAVGNLSLSAFAYANTSYQRGNTYNPNLVDIRQYTIPNNTTIFAENIWSHDNPDGTLPGVAANPYTNRNPAGNDFNLRDASFLRLRNISLAYQLPSSLLSRFGGAEDLRIVVDLQDLGILTRYPGFDPEFTEPNPYPKAYTFTIGAQVAF